MTSLKPRSFTLCCLIAVSGLAPGIAHAKPLPPDAQRMLDAAILSGKADRIDAVAAIARETWPDSENEVKAQVAAFRAEKEKMRLTELRNERFWEGWSGQGELGGSMSTGNDKSSGFTLGLNLNKEDLNWQHKFNALVDYHRSDGVTEKKRLSASYQGQRKISRTLYVYGLLQYEGDRPAGYIRRFSEGTGLGVRLIDRPGMRLDMDGGPAFRQTAFVTGEHAQEISARASITYKWTISPTLEFTQNASAYLSNDSTFTSTSALNSKLFGAVSSRLSFDLRHETDPAAGAYATDTVSRITLLYSF